MNTVNPIHRVETTGTDHVAAPEDIAAAAFYEEKFVPALFKPWSSLTIESAGVRAGERVLDVACGTGVVTRDVAVITGPGAPPVGLDLSPGMLSVARSLDASIEWRVSDAVELPFEDRSFDRVVCQFGLMFFADRVRALAEMRRVLRPGGRLAVAVWDSLERNPGYAEKVEVLERCAGEAAANALRAPFCLGDRERLAELADAAGLGEVCLETQPGQACFDSLFDFVDVDLRGWLPVMGVRLDEADIADIHRACKAPLKRFVDTRSGRVLLPASAHLLSAGA